MGQISSTLKSVTKTVPEGDLKGGSQVARQGPGAACPWPAPGCCLGPPGTPSRRLFAYKSPLDLKVTGESPYIHENFRSHRQCRNQVLEDRTLFQHPASGELPPKAIAIDFTAISIAVADSHDEEGVVLPRG